MHKFKLRKVFSLSDITKKVNFEEMEKEPQISKLLHSSNRDSVFYVVNNKDTELNKWLIEHGALLKEEIVITNG